MDQIAYSSGVPRNNFCDMTKRLGNSQLWLHDQHVLPNIRGSDAQSNTPSPCCAMGWPAHHGKNGPLNDPRERLDEGQGRCDDPRRQCCPRDAAHSIVGQQSGRHSQGYGRRPGHGGGDQPAQGCPHLLPRTPGADRRRAPRRPAPHTTTSAVLPPMRTAGPA